MALFRGLFVQRDGSNNGTTPKGARLALGGLIGRSSTGTVQAGVLVDGMTPVVSGTGTMSYSVRACAIVTKASDAIGPTISGNDAAVVVTTTAAPGSNSRIDTVYATQNLITSDGGSGTSNEFTISVAQGSVSATPSAPSIPAESVALFDVTVTSGVTATSGLTFTRRHQWVTANGGVIPDPANPDYGWVWNGSTRSMVAIGSQSQNVSFTAPFIADGTQGATLTRIGRMVYLQGAMRSSGGDFGPGTTTVATVPTGWRPQKNHVWRPVPGNSIAGTLAMTVTTAGAIQIDTASTLQYTYLATSWITPEPTPPSV